MVQKAFVDFSFEESLATVRGGRVGPDQFFVGATPQELHAIYSRGFRGVRKETQTPEQKVRFQKFIAAQPSLYEIFPWAKGIGKGKLSCPYFAILHFSPSFGGDEAQDGGDCTVHGTANACETDHANDALFGETTYQGRLCKENIYRYRGRNSDGWSCEEPCWYVGPEGPGGLLYRKVYTSPDGKTSVDLSKYNYSWARNGSAGVPSWMEAESKKNKVKWVIPIRNMEEYRDAIAIGFGINICSGQGFSSTSDDWGVCAAQGSWSHSMSHQACDDRDATRAKYGDLVGWIQQQWGAWMNRKGLPPGVSTMPVGMFGSRARTILSMLNGQDSFAMCGVWGWERTGWEAFDVTELTQHLRNSTTQDYYKTRQEKSQEFVEKCYDEMFLVT